LKRTSLKIDFLLITTIILIIAGVVIHLINAKLSKDKITAILITKSASIINSEKLEISTILKQNIRASLNLSQNPFIIKWLANENDRSAKNNGLKTINSYKSLFYKSDIFVAIEKSKNFYFGLQFKSKLSKSNPDDSWYWDAIKGTNYILNIDYNKVLDQTKLWINIPIRVNGKLLGVIGSGVDLSEIVKKTVRRKDIGEEIILFNRLGQIKAHKNIDYINSKTIFELFNEDKQALLGIKNYLQSKKNIKIYNFIYKKRGHNFIVSISYLKNARWFALIKINIDNILSTINLLSISMITIIIIIIFIVLYLLINKKIIKPFLILNNHLKNIMANGYILKLEVEMENEFSEIADTINDMNQRIQNNTEELERTVKQRTQKLETSLKELHEKDDIISAEIEFAAKVQKSLIPNNKQTWEDITINSFIKEMSLIGGDIFDIIKSQDKLIIYLADVSGHGAPAAMITMMAKVMFTQAADRFSDPAEIIASVNDKIYLSLNKKNSRNIHYLTSFVITIDKNMNFYYSSAGHHPAIIYKKETNNLEQMEIKGGPMLGVFPEEHFTANTGFGHLSKGDRILLYTDGLIEQRNTFNEHFEISNLWEISQTHLREKSTETGLEGILTDLDSFSKGCEQNDDITVILIGRED